MSETIIMDSKAMHRALVRIAHEIVERNHGTKDLAIIGIKRRGDHLGRRVQGYIKDIEGVSVPFGAMDIALYRDDFQKGRHQPIIHQTVINFDISGKIIVLVDDVLYTGRTIRAALSELIDFGRPREIQLAVLVDRGHREVPIRADYVGKNIPTQKTDNVTVRVKEIDTEDLVKLEVKA